MEKLLSGNEAIARGAYEFGVAVATAYPGTPSTEILENFAKYKNVYAEWAPNEKVAFEVGIGASLGGARTLVAMKHVGLNVAADPFFTFSYIGVQGGFIIVSCDDPSMHSSQNEQDNRHYAKSAKIPMLEPVDSQEAKDMVGLAIRISEKFDTPVMLRTTTRISHSKSLVKIGERKEAHQKLFLANPTKYVMLPSYGRLRHPYVEERLKKLANFSEKCKYNKIELRDKNIGIITSGVSYQYAKEIFPKASFLKLGMTYPLPQKLIKEFSKKVKKILVIEELDPFLEEQIKLLGIKVIGKEKIPITEELNPQIIEEKLLNKKRKFISLPNIKIPPRPPIMCPGCPHRGILYTLKKLNLIVFGDIGCYTLGVYPPLNSIDFTLCMGAGIGAVSGYEKAQKTDDYQKAVAVIGDSTFVHSGIAPLLDIVYNKGISTVIILDNETTAMTGRQDHPGTGKTLMGERTKKLDYEKLGKALEVDNVRIIDPYDLKKTKEVIEEEVNKKESSLIISRRICVLMDKSHKIPYQVNKETCRFCETCIKLGCPAIVAEKIKVKGKEVKLPSINKLLCTGCSVCLQVCKFNAIEKGN